ncbi:MAG: hypothetical protein NVS3B2_08180 [Ramlibacter sp.]
MSGTIADLDLMVGLDDATDHGGVAAARRMDEDAQLHHEARSGAGTVRDCSRYLIGGINSPRC